MEFADARGKLSIFGKAAIVAVGLTVFGAILVIQDPEPPVKPIPMTLGGVQDYVGKTVLVGVRELGRDEQPKRQMEWIGRIVRLSAEEGIVIELDGGPPCVLPPDLQYLEAATPGAYQLHSTERIVGDPDFVTTWTYIDHLGSGQTEVTPPTWSPAWRSKGYWASR